MRIRDWFSKLLYEVRHRFRKPDSIVKSHPETWQVVEMNVIDPGPYLLKGNDSRYPSSHDVALRLNKTVVRWQGQPVFVQGLNEGTQVILWDMHESGQTFIVDANDSRLDISSPNLGFFMYGSRAYYVTRRPIRSQRQGLDVERLNYYDIASGGWTGFHRDDMVMFGLRKMIMREYPPISAVKDPEISSIAISPTWGIRKTSSRKHAMVYHKTELVGIFNPDKSEFYFLPGRRTALRVRSLSGVLTKQNGENYVIA